MMKLTRRDLLHMTAAGVPLAVLAACKERPQPPATPSAAKPDPGVMLGFVGLSLLLRNDYTATPGKAAIVLVNPKGIPFVKNRVPTPLPEHQGFLRIPTTDVLHTSDAKPEKEHEGHNVYALNRMNVTFELKDSEQLASPVVPARRPLRAFTDKRHGTHPCGVSGGNRNSLDWIMDVRSELLPSKFSGRELRADWETCKYTYAVVRLNFGVLEHPEFASDAAGAGADKREWELSAATSAGKLRRGFKEGARHLFDEGKFLHITFRSLDDPAAKPSVVVLDRAKQTEITIDHKPPSSTAHAGASTTLDDLVGYLAMFGDDVLDEGLAGQTLPTKVGDVTTCTSASEGCQCCPTGGAGCCLP